MSATTTHEPADTGSAGRLFLGVPLPTATRESLQMHLSTALRGEQLPGRPVTVENWHLTLRFLGDTRASTAERLRPELAATDLGPPFAARFGGFGAFPQPRRAAVLWVGFAAGEAELSRLAEQLETAARAVGLPAEERPFRAHLTLSRMRPPRNLEALLAEIPPFPGSLAVEEVTLFRSHLGRGSPRYEPLERFRLTA